MINDLFIGNFRLTNKVSEDLNIIPQNRFNEFIKECNSVSNNLIESIDNNDLNDFPNSVNSKYHDIHQFNQIKPDPISSLGLMHTNLAPIGKHFDDLNLILSLLKFDFHIIGISEHKIHKHDCNSIRNIDFDPTETSHGGTGFYIKESLVYVRRDDLKFNSPGNYEPTFIEIILPNRKNLILGCVYRHPTSTITIQQFNNDYIDPLLEQFNDDYIDPLLEQFNDDYIDPLLEQFNDDYIDPLLEQFNDDYIDPLLEQFNDDYIDPLLE